MPQEFKKFRQLLDMAICRKTQAQFAKDAKISAEHLNRMINSPKISRPTNATVKKIAAVAENGVTYKDLIDALDSEDPDYKKVDYAQLKYQEAVRDFTPTFKERVKESYAVLAEIVAKKQPAVVGSLDAYMEELLREYREDCDEAKIEPIEISYYICEDHYKYIGRKFKTENADEQDAPIEFRSVLLSSAEGRETVESEIILYTMQMPLMTAQFPYMVVGSSMAVEDLFELFGLYREMCGDIEYGPDMNLEAALAQPFYLDFNEPERNTVREKEFLRQLFNPAIEIPTCTTGFGFYTDEVCPEKFYNFVRNHKDALLSEYHKQPDRFKELSGMFKKMFEETDALLKSGTQENAQWFDNFIMQLEQYVVLYDEKESIIGDIISTVMCNETGFTFSMLHPSESTKYDDILNKKTCVMLTEEASAYHNVHKTTMMNLLAKYGKELGIKRFGEIRYVWMQRFFNKAEVYTIKTEEPTHSEPEEVDAESWNDISKKPEQSGMYTVLLKDGRFLNCIYLDKHDVWIKRHKEWSYMIDKWNPKAIKTLGTTEKPSTDLNVEKHMVKEIKSVSEHNSKKPEEAKKSEEEAS